MMNNLSYDDLRKAGIDRALLLGGRYEADRLPKDFSPERIVPDFAFNILQPLGLLYRPVLDEAYLADGGTKPVWPDAKPFAACLSHDVDNVTLHSMRQALRGRKDALKRPGDQLTKAKNVLGVGADFIRTSRHRGPDPLHRFEQWMQVEEAVGARSTFFFWPGLSSVTKRHKSDCTYELTDKLRYAGSQCTVAEMIRDMHSKGWEIGLHPSWYSFDDADEMKRQKAALEKALQKEVVSVRQHQLHYDIRVTPQVHAAAGFRYDSTLGFNDNIGFRNGTSYPWKQTDLTSGTELPITQIPLIAQDGALMSTVKGLRLDEDMAFEYVKRLTEAVEKVGGIITLVWHPDVVIESWWRVYVRTIRYLKEKNAWFGTIREAGEHFQKAI